MAAEAEKTEGETANTAEKQDVAAPLDCPLHKPIMAHGDEIKVLKFREPSAADIELVGNPVLLDFSGGGTKPQPRFDAAMMSAMMSRLAAVPPSSIKSMSTRDWNNAAWMLSSFFMPDL